MCISGKLFGGSSKKSSTPAKPVEQKKKATLLNQGGKDKSTSVSPQSSVGYAGKSGFDSFGNTSSKAFDPRPDMKGGKY